MHLGYGLNLRQEQRLILTPELRQALAILQLPVAELEAFVQDQMLENPMLNLVGSPAAGGADQDAPNPPQPEPEPERWEKVDGAAEQWLEYAGMDPLPAGRAADPDEPWPEPPPPGPSLAEHLLGQLGILDLPADARRAAAYLIHSLDARGYLTVSTVEAAVALGLPETAVSQGLTAVRSLDPAGVGAADLRDCLLLQCAVRWPEPTPEHPARLLKPIILDHLEELAGGRMARVADALGVAPRQVQAALDLLRHLDTRPGVQFDGGAAIRYIVPDVTVERVGADFVVLVNDAIGPRLRLSAGYRRLLARRSGDAEARRYLEGRLTSALWLIRSVEQRRLTLYRVVETMVRLQRPFFTHGLRHLRPMTLREVAVEIGMHESTISRAVAGKYAQTPQGVFALKFFFSSGVDSEAGEGVSAESVKRRIRDLIQTEEARSPFSDQALTRLLEEAGIRISRRTVAKYREEAGLQASAQRRRF